MTLVGQPEIRSLAAPIFIRLSSPASGLSAWPPRFPCRKLIGFPLLPTYTQLSFTSPPPTQLCENPSDRFIALLLHPILDFIYFACYSVFSSRVASVTSCQSALLDLLQAKQLSGAAFPHGRHHHVGTRFGGPQWVITEESRLLLRF